LASELINAINEAKLDNYKRAHIEEPALPAITASKSLAERVAQAFHVLVRELEALGIRFRKFHGIHETGYFERHGDRLYTTITEDVVRTDGSRVTAPWWKTPQLGEKPSGYLTFTFKPHRFNYEGIQQWSQSPKLPLEKTLLHVVSGVRKHFLELQERREQEKLESAKRHAEWLERKREMDKQEAIRLQQEKERKHAAALAAAAHARQTALFKAAQNWRLSNSLLEFIGACEARWRSQLVAPTAEQIAWLTWAKEIATTTSPFSAGYPDPAIDGAFDPASVPFAGPYPPTRDFA
jgi:hypothetical protein